MHACMKYINYVVQVYQGATSRILNLSRQLGDFWKTTAVSKGGLDDPNSG